MNSFAKTRRTKRSNGMKNNLALIRHARGLTQKELAARIGLPQTWVSRCESGVLSVENITLKNAAALAKALDCRIEDFLGDPREEFILLAAAGKQAEDLERSIAEGDIDEIINNGLAR